MDHGGDFDHWLRGQLAATLGPERGPRPSPAQARYAAASRAAAARGSVPGRFARSGAALLAAGAAAALAAGGAAATAATGSANPVSWGRDVVQAVQQCKEARGQQSPGGSHGIGSCVSSTARQHGAGHQPLEPPGASPSAAASPSPSATAGLPPGKRVGQQTGGQPPGNGNGGNGAGNGNGTAGSGQAGAHGHGQGQAEGAGHGTQGRPVSSPKG